MSHEQIIQKKTIEWIESHLHEQMSAEDIAHVAGFSKYHFHRIFQSAVGMSVTSYIQRRRFANAAAALLHTDHRILDIALLYQFESQEAFTRAFKKIYHLPSGKYRKNHEEYHIEKGGIMDGKDSERLGIKRKPPVSL